MSKTIIVPTNAHMSYIVSKEGYSTVKGDVIVDEDKVVNVVLEEQSSVNFTINPTPSDAIVTLTADGYTQEGNSITVDKGTNVEYSVGGPNTKPVYAWKSSNGNIIYTLVDSINDNTDYLPIFNNDKKLILDTGFLISNNTQRIIPNENNIFFISMDDGDYYRDDSFDTYMLDPGYTYQQSNKVIVNDTTDNVTITSLGNLVLNTDDTTYIKKGQYQLYNVLDEHIGTLDTTSKTASSFSVTLDKSKLIGNAILFYDTLYDYSNGSNSVDNCEIVCSYFDDYHDYSKYNFGILITDMSKSSATFHFDNDD